MSLIFPYTIFPTLKPIWTLHGRQSRPRPVIFVAVIGPTGTAVEKGLLDIGADDTVFPDLVATDIGIDLSQALTGGAWATPALSSFSAPTFTATANWPNSRSMQPIPENKPCAASCWENRSTSSIVMKEYSCFV
jgi:hypothetical protein